MAALATQWTDPVCVLMAGRAMIAVREVARIQPRTGRIARSSARVTGTIQSCKIHYDTFSLKNTQRVLFLGALCSGRSCAYVT